MLTGVNNDDAIELEVEDEDEDEDDQRHTTGALASACSSNAPARERPTKRFSIPRISIATYLNYKVFLLRYL